MKALRLAPSVDNFLSLYAFTTKRSGDRGFFYLSTKKDCRYLKTLKSNLGPRQKKYIFILPPASQVWHFRLEWTKYKPIPKRSGGGLEGDQINGHTAYRYDPKRLLIEEVLWLNRLSPAPLHVKNSFGDLAVLLSSIFHSHLTRNFVHILLFLADKIVMNSRIALRLKALQNKHEAQRVATLQIQTPSPARGSHSMSPSNPEPILVDNEETLPSPIPNEQNSPSRASEDLGPEEEVGANGANEADEGTSSKKRKRDHHKHKGKMSNTNPNHPSIRNHQSHPNRVRAVNLDFRAGWPKKLFTKPKSKGSKRIEEQTSSHFELKDERFVLSWNISSSSSVLYGRPGQDSWELFSNCILPRDQASLLMNPHTRLEEHAAHSLLQTVAFYHNMALKYTSYRRNHMIAEKKKALVAEVQDLKNELSAYAAEASKAKEDAFAEGKKEGFAADREVGHVEDQKEGFQACHSEGVEEGKVDCITLKEHQKLLSSSHLPTAHDFVKSSSFQVTVEIKAVEFFNKGFCTCKAQLNSLWGPYPDEPAPGHDEFLTLLDKIEPLKLGPDSFMFFVRLIP
ncbi:UNVERIFIED_CONTAM: hypothetical protein Sindi_1266800 [Sesamum indicum]